MNIYKFAIITGTLLFINQLSIAQKGKITTNNPNKKVKSSVNDTIVGKNGLKILITKRGKSPLAEDGDVVSVNYIGKLTNGEIFDQSKGNPFKFNLGQHEVIEGWDQGIKYLGKGDQATLIIPPNIGYGAQQQGSIPANSTLIFDVEIMEIIKPTPIDLSGKDVKTTATGLKYYYIQTGNGRKTQVGDNVLVHYTGKLMNGKKFDSSHDRESPFTVPLGQGRVIKGWEEALALMSVGDKAAFIIPPSLAYGNREVGEGLIPANSTLYFEIEVLDTKTPAKPKAQPFEIISKDTITTASGLKYIVFHKSNSGKKPSAGQNVSVHYTGSLLSGKKFDSSLDRNQALSFPIGTGRVIKGWDEGIMLMEIGDCYRLIIPAELGYGAQDVGNGLIPANSTLVFDCELMGIE